MAYNDKILFKKITPYLFFNTKAVTTPLKVNEERILIISNANFAFTNRNFQYTIDDTSGLTIPNSNTNNKFFYLRPSIGNTELQVFVKMSVFQQTYSYTFEKEIKTFETIVHPFIGLTHIRIKNISYANTINISTTTLRFELREM